MQKVQTIYSVLKYIYKSGDVEVANTASSIIYTHIKRFIGYGFFKCTIFHSIIQSKT